jgi:hypothetical protein
VLGIGENSKGAKEKGRNERGERISHWPRALCLGLCLEMAQDCALTVESVPCPTCKKCAKRVPVLHEYEVPDKGQPEGSLHILFVIWGWVD